MNLARVEPIVNAVLYEGYMLYPYRPSAVKNRQRWTFGGIYPQAYSQAQGGGDAWSMQTECLVEGDERAELAVRIRFLHLLAREVGALDAPLPDLPPGVDLNLRPVAALPVGDEVFHTWQEAVEREAAFPDLALGDLAASARRLEFGFPARRETNPLRDPSGAVVGAITRRQHALSGAVELSAAPLGERVFKISARVVNLTPLDENAPGRDDALMRSFASTHIILGVAGGQFVSLLDPPERLREAAAGCRNLGAWPVLVGEEGQRDLMLASPIILYDYPQVAPESAGDLFDGTEIDEILTLRILTMTDEEKREMGAADERARALLQRTESLTGDQLMQMHGTVRNLRRVEEG